MVLWTLAILVTAISCAALFYAARAASVNAGGGSAAAAETALQRARLAEIEADLAQGRIAEQDALAAKAELAREVIRAEKAGTGSKAEPATVPGWALPGATLGIAVISLGLYGFLGSPDLPGLPLATRAPETTALTLEEAVARIEAQMALTPDDVRGWQALAPVYMQTGRFADAATAYRRILDLQPPTADAETDLAEALMMAQGGSAQGEALTLLQSAAARDDTHIRSRFYLAGEAIRTSKYAEAITLWREVLALANGDEEWLPTAERGLEIALAGEAGEPLPELAPPAQADSEPAAVTPLAPDADQREMIMGMVEGLADRLASEGGSVEEWTRLVRSWLVLGDREAAQRAYDDGRAAWPDETERAELDALAAANGLD